MKPLSHLRLHVVNVDHGDAMILEISDYENQAHFGIIDTGRPESEYRARLTDYLKALIDLRELDDAEWKIDFVCITHPHEDHYGGLSSLLDNFPGKITQFWDCGFRTVAKTYNKLLDRIAKDDSIAYLRLASGFEIELCEVRISALAPSLDLRNRFDTFGVDRNNASVVLKVQFKNSIAVLAGDAFFDSWGKIAEEFPRTTKITYFNDANVERSEGTNQLNCQLLKVSHHGSKHGTSLEYLEKLSPQHFMITCADPVWYLTKKPGWGIDWPHPLSIAAINEVRANPGIRISNQHGNVIYYLRGTRNITADQFIEIPGDPAFKSELDARLI